MPDDNGMNEYYIRVYNVTFPESSENNNQNIEFFFTFSKIVNFLITNKCQFRHFRDWYKFLNVTFKRSDLDIYIYNNNFIYNKAS